jgi:hypothetical protein
VTKSVPLEQPELLFDSKLQPWKAHKVVMADLQVLDREIRAVAKNEITTVDAKDGITHQHIQGETC